MEAHKADFTATPSIEDIVDVSSTVYARDGVKKNEAPLVALVL